MGKKSRRSRASVPASAAEADMDIIDTMSIGGGDPPSLNDENRPASASSSTGRKDASSAAGCTHAYLESLVPSGLLDLKQSRDWPHRRGDPIADPSLFTLPMKEGPGLRSHPCENCGGSCLMIHDNVLCWKCHGTFCFTCTTAHIPGGPSGVAQMRKEQIIEGWGTCPSCAEPLRAIALLPVFRQVIEMTSAGVPGARSTSLVLEEKSSAMFSSKGFYESGDRGRAVEALTRAINAINYHSALSPGGELSRCEAEDLAMYHALRATMEGNDELRVAIKDELMPKIAFRSDSRRYYCHTDETEQPCKSTEEDAVFRSFFYPVPTAWCAGTSNDGLLCIDMRTNDREVALHSDEFEEQVSIQSGAHLEFLQRELPNCVPDPTENSFALSFGCTQSGCSFYTPAIGAGPPSRGVRFMGQSAELGCLAQFVFAFDNAAKASNYIDSAIESGKAGDQVPPMSCKVDDGLTQRLRQILRLDNVNETPLLPEASNIKVLKGTYAMGPLNITGYSVLASINHIFTRFWISVTTSTHNDTDSEESGVLCLAKEGLLHVRRQIIGTRSLSTRELVMHNTSKYCFATNVCSFCSAAPESDEILKRCTGCGEARYCSQRCQKLHWKMKGPFAHKQTCSREFKDKSFDSSALISPGKKVQIDGLKSASGQAMNGKEALVLSEANSDSRVELVLLDVLEEIERSSARDQISSNKKKLIKLENLTLL